MSFQSLLINLIYPYWIIICIYAFSRRFYPKRLTVHSGYSFIVSMCVPWESNPQRNALPLSHITISIKIMYWSWTVVHSVVNKNVKILIHWLTSASYDHLGEKYLKKTLQNFKAIKDHTFHSNLPQMVYLQLSHWVSQILNLQRKKSIRSAPPGI